MKVTCTGGTISIVAVITSTVISTFYICTISIFVTVLYMNVVWWTAFVIVYKKRKKNLIFLKLKFLKITFLLNFLHAIAYPRAELLLH